jgi:acyl-lipid omega-6 desaturase (Delta-12 desaturase)
VGVACALLVFTPFHSWRHEHAVHHATAGDLDHRGMGDVDTLTVAEYLALPCLRRLEHRLMRNPLVMLGLGPLWALVLEPRLVPRWARRRFWRTITATDIALGALCVLFGWNAVLLVQLPSAMLAGAPASGSSLSSTSSKACTGDVTTAAWAAVRRRGASCFVRAALLR